MEFEVEKCKKGSIEQSEDDRYILLHLLTRASCSHRGVVTVNDQCSLGGWASKPSMQVKSLQSPVQTGFKGLSTHLHSKYGCMGEPNEINFASLLWLRMKPRASGGPPEQFRTKGKYNSETPGCFSH